MLSRPYFLELSMTSAGELIVLASCGPAAGTLLQESQK
jgi:hypothetical protein